MITIARSGNLIKIDDGRTSKFVDPNAALAAFKIYNTNVIIQTLGPDFVYDVPYSQITINGIIPANSTDFQTQLNAVIAPVVFKLDPLVATGFFSTAVTSPVRRIAALGNNPDVDGGTLPETVWPLGGLYPYMTGATSLEVVSSSAQDSASGTGAASISMALLDTNYVGSTVVISLNGTTPVAIPGSWFRINVAFVITKGSGASATRATNVGDISIRNSGAGTVRAIIPAGHGISRQAVFTVDAGYTLQVISHYISLNRGTGGGAGVSKYLTVSNFAQTPTGVSRNALDLSCDGEPYRHDGIPGIIVPEKTDYEMQAVAVSADNSDVTAAFLGILVRNDIISTISYP